MLASYALINFGVHWNTFTLVCTKNDKCLCETRTMQMALFIHVSRIFAIQ